MSGRQHFQQSVGFGWDVANALKVLVPVGLGVLRDIAVLPAVAVGGQPTTALRLGHVCQRNGTALSTMIMFHPNHDLFPPAHIEGRSTAYPGQWHAVTVRVDAEEYDPARFFGHELFAVAGDDIDKAAQDVARISKALIIDRTDHRDETLTAEQAAVALIDGKSVYMCGNGQLSTGKPGQAVVYRWMCPYCEGTGRWGDGSDSEVCRHCAGTRVTNDVSGWDESYLTRTPRPPAVMRSPCVDCAYRPGSPEQEAGIAPGPETPFYCHHGMIRDGDGYITPAYVGNLPLGAHVCAGWYALATGEPLPDAAFRDPGGSDRQESVPETIA
jgi:hypothetical protein